MPDLESVLPDLTDVDLDDVLAIDLDTPLGAALARVVGEADKPQDVVAGFQSAI